MKKTLSLVFALILSITAFPFYTLAESENMPQYTEEQAQEIYQKYINEEHMLDGIFCKEDGIAYWKAVNQLNEDGVFSWALDTASRMIDEYPTKQDYVEILTNLIVMQEGELAEEIEMQSQFDHLKTDADFAWDVADIAGSLAGEFGTETADAVSLVLDTIGYEKDVVVSTIDQAKLLETTIRDYAQTETFLNAVVNYAQNEELKSAAQSLLNAPESLLEKRMELFVNASNASFGYSAKYFFKNMPIDILKDAAIYQTDEAVKFFVDCGSKLSKSLLSKLGIGEFVFRMVILIGDIGFGTSNTFNRYQEMKIVADVAQALIKAKDEIVIPADAGSPSSVLNDIRKRCDYYKMIICTHARGEYLAYQLLTSDAGFLSTFRNICDAFKSPDETTEGWYNSQTEVMKEYLETLDKIFAVSGNNGDNSKTEQEYIARLQTKITNGGTISETLCDDFDGNGTLEMFAFVKAATNSFPDAVTGEFWFVSPTTETRLTSRNDYEQRYHSETEPGTVLNSISFGTYKFVFFSKYATTGGLITMYGVEGEDPEMTDLSDEGVSIHALDDKNLTLTESSYGASIDGSGHVWNDYYFYWDETEHRFKEYGGISITREELEAVPGADPILKKIDEAGGNINNIYYRGNDIININYTEGYNINNLTLKIENGRVNYVDLGKDWVETEFEKAQGGGLYRAALIPEIAKYPVSFSY